MCFLSCIHSISLKIAALHYRFAIIIKLVTFSAFLANFDRLKAFLLTGENESYYFRHANRWFQAQADAENRDLSDWFASGLEAAKLFPRIDVFEGFGFVIERYFDDMQCRIPAVEFTIAAGQIVGQMRQ